MGLPRPCAAAVTRPLAAVALLATALVAACSDSTEPVPRPVVARIAVAGLPDTVGVGDTLRPTLQALDTAGTVLPRVSFRWRSLSRAVATTDSAGPVVARAEGEALLVVTAFGRTSVQDTIAVPVRRLPRRIEILGLDDTLRVRGVDTATAVVRDGLGAVLDVPVRWSSSDTTTFTLLDTTTGRATGRETGQA